MKNVAIIGCGYVGTSLALFWKKKNYNITATVSQVKQSKTLSKIIPKTIIAKGTDKSIIEKLIAENDIILLTVSTSFSQNFENTFLRTAQTLRQAALQSKQSKTLIYTSNCIVYGEHKGQWVDEKSPLHPITEQSKILIETEKTLLSLQEKKWKVCVFRLGEIYGPNREISKTVKQLDQQVLPGKGNQYTNMVHRDDVIASVDYSLSYHLEGVYNIVDDDHPTKAELYDEISNRLFLPKITWDPTLTKIDHGNQRVSNHKIKASGYTFLHPHREWK
ncbi:MAG: NAD-dependent epimerase/dehydratase family protein [Chlamydiota bacterium]